MTDHVKTVDIRPQVGVFSVFEAVTYKAWYALAEFVDNSIQSYLDNQKRLSNLGAGSLDVFIEADGDQIVIRDNAAGISADRFDVAFEVGKPPPGDGGLSVYGIGMKSAAAWFADRFTVTTSALGEPVRRTLDICFSEIIREELDHLPVQEVEAPIDEHGTEVVLSGLKNPIRSRTQEKVASHLGSIYRRFLTDGQLTLTYRGSQLSFEEPAILVAPPYSDPDGEPNEWRKEIITELSTGEILLGFAGIRETGQTRSAGFALFRNRRVITGLEEDPWRPYEIFGPPNKYRSQRLFGELDVQDVKVAYSKNGFVWQASEEEILERLREALDEEPLPLLRQAEYYRKRRADDQKLDAASKALTDTAEAVERTVESDLPGVLSKSGSEETPSELPDGVRTVAAREFTVQFQSQTWTICIEASEEESGRWVDVSDWEGGEDSEGRRVGLRLNLAHPFTLSFGGAEAEDLEVMFRLGSALGLAVVAAIEQGGTPAAVVDHMSRILEGRLSERRP